MDEQRQEEQLEPIYSSYVRIPDVALNTYRERWVIESCGERGSVKSVVAAPHYDDDACTEALPLNNKRNLIYYYKINEIKLWKKEGYPYLTSYLFFYRVVFAVKLMYQ